MYISFLGLFIVFVGVVILLVIAAKLLKAKIIEEKRTSFSFVLGAVIESCNLVDTGMRVDWIAKRLADVCDNEEAFVTMTRAACMLQSLKKIFDEKNGSYEPVLGDSGGEYTRFLMVSTVGFSHPMAQQLVDIAIALCGENPDIFPIDEFCEILLGDERFVKNGESTFTTVDLTAGKLIIERALVSLYGCRGI